MKKLPLWHMIVLKHMAMRYDFQYRLRELRYYAQFDASANMIEVDPNSCQRRDVFISSLLHEICHLIAFRTNKFKIFHEQGNVYNGLQTRTIRVYLQTALRAERYVDQQAEKMCAKEFPSITFCRSYRDKESISFLNADLESLRSELARRNMRKRRA